MRRSPITYAIAMTVFVGAEISQAADWMINEDYKQLDTRPASDFEMFFGGDMRAQITGGGMSFVTNAFPNPTRTQSYDAATNVTTVRFAGTNPGDTIPRDANQFRHFGLFGSGPKPRVFFKSWSFSTQPARVPVPKSNFDFSYNPITSDLTVVLENTSDDTVSFSEVGFLLAPTERPIADLSRTVLPPSAFNPLPSLAGEYLPGVQQSIVLSGVSLSSYIVTYGTVQFSGSSSGNAYDDVGGEWSQVRVAANIIPEPASLTLLTVPLVLLAARRRARRDQTAARHAVSLPAGLLRRPLSAALCFFVAAGMAHFVRGNDIYAIPLKPTNLDTRPRINLTVNVAGNPQNVHTLIDTGAGVGLYVKSHASGRLNMNAGGNAGQARGVGGAVPTRRNVPVPAGLMLMNPAAVPPGQASTSPMFPGTATVGRGAPGTDAIIGSNWLAGFNYGRTRGAQGEYFWLASRAKGVQGETDARNIARLLVDAMPYTAQPNARPVDEKTEEIVPIPVPPTLPGEEPMDLGFSMDLDLTNLLTGATSTEAFLIKSGSDTTLLSESTAAALGIGSGGQTATELNFDVFNVPTADVGVSIFDGADAEFFKMTVGIVPDSLNPFGLNVVGSDLLEHFFYWEMDVAAGQTGGFFRAAIPEPGTASLLAFTMIFLTTRRRL